MSAIASPIPGISVRRPSSMRRSSGIGSAARLSAAREYALARYGLPPRRAVRCAYSRRSFATVWESAAATQRISLRALFSGNAYVPDLSRPHAAPAVPSDVHGLLDADPII